MFECVPNCGECCGIVPIEALVYNSIKLQVSHPVVKEMEIENGYIIPITETGVCAFLDTNNRCGIYLNRPQVCRDYGIIDKLPCHRLDKDGILRSRAERRRVHRLADRNAQYKIRSLIHG